MTWIFLETWSPYIAGMGIGILSGLTLLISNKTLSCSTTFAKSAGLIEKQFRADKASVDNRPFFRRNPAEIDWQWMLVAGVFLGALLSAVLSGSFQVTLVSDWWTQLTDSGAFGRLSAAFAGGICLGFGARWADGCTSGHGISGIIQLSVSSLVAAACFFAGGIGTAFLMTALFSGSPL